MISDIYNTLCKLCLGWWTFYWWTGLIISHVYDALFDSWHIYIIFAQMLHQVEFWTHRQMVRHRFRGI